jgi:hypothetical protein
VSSKSEQVIELFPTRDEAEELLALMLKDEPDWREVVRIERQELGGESKNYGPHVVAASSRGPSSSLN